MSRLGWLTGLVALLIAAGVVTVGFVATPGASVAPHVLVTPAPTPEMPPSPYLRTGLSLPPGPPPQAGVVWRGR